jgi:alkyl hydroperoxide reductase subunit AhpC
MFSSLRSLATAAPRRVFSSLTRAAMLRPAVATSVLRPLASAASVSAPKSVARSFSSEGFEYNAESGFRSAFVSEPAPEFTCDAVMPNGEFKKVSLSDYRGKWVVLCFYPLAFTFVCPTEIIAFSDRMSEFKALGAEVLWASVDSQYSLLAWTNTARKQGGIGKVNFPLIADVNHSLAADYGVLLVDQGIALRGTFLVDPNGVLQQSSVNNLPVGRSVDETLRLIKAFQHVEKVGEVCPANWQPGKDTMKADPIGAQEYFKKQKD